MNDQTGKRPGITLQRETGALNDHRVASDNRAEQYTNPLDRQRRHLRNRYGVPDQRAALIAGFVFGGGRRD